MHRFLLLLLLLLGMNSVQSRPSRSKDEDGRLKRKNHMNNKHGHKSSDDKDDITSWVELIDLMNVEPYVTDRRDGPGQQLHQKYCGTRPVEGHGPSTRIIGGQKAELGQFPWQVSLLKSASVQGGKPVLTCGGALISTRSVLTASHCLKLTPDKYEVWVGRMSSLVGEEECHDQKFRVVEYFKHPNYSPSTLQNDVAVLSILSTFEQGVRWTSWVLPACLPAPDQPLLYQAGTKGTVSGWGLLDEQDRYMSPNLQHVTVPIMSQAECQAAYQGLTTLSDSQLCAGERDGGKDACAGDSGGPLAVQDGASGRFYVAGIVSFGMGCGRAEYPGVYTRVEKFVNWVLEMVDRIEGGRTQQPLIVGQPMKSVTLSTTKSTKPTTTTTSPLTKHKLDPVCRGYYRRATCKAGRVIRVLSASFGREAGNTGDCKGDKVPRRLRGKNCALPSAGQELASWCDGKRSCKVTTRVGRGKIFSRNPCYKQRPFVTMIYLCEVRSGDVQRAFSDEDDYEDLSDQKMFGKL